eukprot:CAMPEP_0183294874 /NCGR_PEP_ID=MMETSP0160_2-20130417/3035_1 /TAXON_ID=2839 ORGANISM="Odontella Sinensis, Strain Grunow 1884" /NCGR_SAMPLE_ID=MMETSP0160_2 /ASSEMBLY_ACC=CAM_ASM_000250 /LENGTH=312 /DNA_ID=CAMNT_0025456257 /DNA_START=33 /DNA_END=971 /DNA_ORIENTATION=-
MENLSVRKYRGDDLLSSPLNNEEILSRISVMKKQERENYRLGDYIGQIEVLSLSRADMCDQIDEECRGKMSFWCYQVIDHCKLNRETVEIAMFYLDRFLLSRYGERALKSRRKFQLAAMTALYIALKLHEDVTVGPKTMCTLSRGSYSDKDFVEMEVRMLVALQWHVHPPTSSAFISHFLLLLPTDILSESELAQILEFSKHQAEVAVNEYYFVPIKSSIIALAAISNSLEMLLTHDDATLSNYVQRLENIASIRSFSSEFLEVKSKLLETAAEGAGLYHYPSPCISYTQPSSAKRVFSQGEISPRCASFGV